MSSTISAIANRHEIGWNNVTINQLLDMQLRVIQKKDNCLNVDEVTSQIYVKNMREMLDMRIATYSNIVLEKMPEIIKNEFVQILNNERNTETVTIQIRGLNSPIREMTPSSHSNSRRSE